MVKKYIITLVAGAILSLLSYAAQNRGIDIPLLNMSEAQEVVEVPVLVVVQPPTPDDANIVSDGPQLAGGAYRDCPTRRRDCNQRWTCRGPVRRVIFAPLRWLFGRRCN